MTRPTVESLRRVTYTMGPEHGYRQVIVTPVADSDLMTTMCDGHYEGPRTVAEILRAYPPHDPIDVSKRLARLKAQNQAPLTWPGEDGE